ncbi:Siroheme synthase 1 [Porphyridium purpureum]|uniref:uroporphyrinogen-III C-methyltransferase n=1 Tax=Porphyridium purpureum TaxID=35688 RepID=A0A5J4YI39_PORPP|nr:Siroheme synthase 1 [Porphyridium purpureum]|eukprot:POR7289..scf243_20
MDLLKGVVGGGGDGGGAAASQSGDAQAATAAQQVFRKFDKDSSGALDKKEVSAALAEVMAKLGMQEPSDSVVTTVVKFMDKDHDSKIDLKEFTSMLERTQQSDASGRPNHVRSETTHPCRADFSSNSSPPKFILFCRSDSCGITNVPCCAQPSRPEPTRAGPARSNNMFVATHAGIGASHSRHANALVAKRRGCLCMALSPVHIAVALRYVRRRAGLPGKVNGGAVHFVGSGCAEIDGISVRGASLLRSCDAVVYDDLVDVSVVNHYCPPEPFCQRIYAGKRGGNAPSTLPLQNHIDELLQELMRAGMQVVRLKAGDPLIFGRISDELAAAEKAGVSCSIVPGFSSIQVAAASIRLPLTKRDVGESVLILSGHKELSDSQVLSACNADLVALLMATKNIERIADRMMRSGLPARTAVIAIQWAGRSDQRVEHTTLLEVQQSSIPHMSPAVVFIGRAVDDWMTSAAALKVIRRAL